MSEKTQYYTSEKAKQEWKEYKKIDKKATKKVLKGAALAEYERIMKGGTDYRLYNFILTTTNFHDCPTAIESCRRVYDGVYPFIKRLERENLYMRELLKDSDNPKMKEILKERGDIQNMAEETLEKIKKERSRMLKSKIEEKKPRII